MVGLELVVFIVAALLLCRVLSQRLRIAAPILQLGIGVLLGFIPALRDVHLEPDMVLLLFLPALLYWEALTSSLQEIRRNLTGIILMSTALVVITAGVVATVVHAFGLGWGPAWVLGAAVAPTDATAVGIIARLLPRRDLTVLKAESLVNDGTALVIYGIAVGVTVGEQQLDAGHVSWLFLLSYAGGILAGALAAFVGVWLRRGTKDSLSANLIFVLIPFTGYLLAELVEASGVLAAVTAGLIISQTSPLVGTAQPRRQIFATWTFGTFLLNGALFLLVGIEAQSAVRGLPEGGLVRGLLLILIVTVLLVAVRVGYLYVIYGTIRLLRRSRPGGTAVTGRSRLVSGLAGFRGAVSLAAALAIPDTLSSGEPFPDRSLIVFVTFGVIVLTMFQGVILPGIVRWAHLPQDAAATEAERRTAHHAMLTAALTALPELAVRTGSSERIAEQVRAEYQNALDTPVEDTPDDEPVVPPGLDLRVALIERQRAELVALRSQHRLDDVTLLELQTQLDIEELRLTRPEGDE